MRAPPSYQSTYMCCGVRSTVQRSQRCHTMQAVAHAYLLAHLPDTSQCWASLPGAYSHPGLQLCESTTTSGTGGPLQADGSLSLRGPATY
jgi:hypothetical protein